MNQPLYHSPIGLYEFQVEGAAHILTHPASMLIFDTGIGKTHVAMASSCIAFEDDLADIILLVGEGGKVGELVDDFKKFTSLNVQLYSGPRRSKWLSDLPQVLAGTYETIRNDCATKAGPRKVISGPLTDALVGKRVIVLYDEVTRLKNRSSKTWKHHAHMLSSIRKDGDLRVSGMTATPIERDPSDYFNIGLCIAPSAMPSVADFERNYISRRDIFDNPIAWKNINTHNHRDPDVPLFCDLFAPLQVRKRKSDPDVRDQFPQQVEEATHVIIHPLHEEAIERAKEIISGLVDEDIADIDKKNTKAIESATALRERSAIMTMRMLAAHPQSLLHSEGEISQLVVESLGRDNLLKIPSRKMDRYIEWATMIADQGAQLVTFTFFSNTVMPYIEDRLRAAGLTVVTYTGGLSESAKTTRKNDFRQGCYDVFLTSDSGARGLNLPEASYVAHFDPPVTYALYRQRSDRIHRIDSKHDSVTSMLFIADHTIEEAIVRVMLKRNGYTESVIDGDVLGDEDDTEWISSAERRHMLGL